MPLCSFVRLELVHLQDQQLFFFFFFLFFSFLNILFRFLFCCSTCLEINFQIKWYPDLRSWDIKIIYDSTFLSVDGSNMCCLNTPFYSHIGVCYNNKSIPKETFMSELSISEITSSQLFWCWLFTCLCFFTWLAYASLETLSIWKEIRMWEQFYWAAQFEEWSYCIWKAASSIRCLHVSLRKSLNRKSSPMDELSMFCVHFLQWCMSGWM